MPRILLPVACAGVAAVSAFLALRSPAPAEDRDDMVTAATPVLSVRRVPEVLTDAVAMSRLASRLDAALASPALGPARESSCLVVEDDDDVIFARRANVSLIPASNMKILTGMAALTRLGAETTFTTELKAAARPVGGVLDGPLWVVGSGDPLLATADYIATFRNQPQVFTPMESLADAVVAAGITHVRGAVMGDESRYDTDRYVDSWKSAYIEDDEIGPASALVVNDGFAQFAPLERVQTTAPATHTAAVLTALLRARGVVVDGAPGEGRSPNRAATVGSVSSPPMSEVVGEMIRESDNLTAELLVKELGTRFGGGGTWASGLEVVRATLAEHGLPTNGMAAVDGSGLSREDRLSCSLLMQAMEVVGPNGKVAGSFPIAGQTGTLARRFLGNPAAGKLWAKTGSLDGVVGLTGYARAEGGQLLAFSLLANELPRDAAGRLLQEAVGAALVSYPEAPSPDEVAPPPPGDS